VIDACVAYLEDPNVSIDRLIELVPGPDFPTGGIILGRSGIRSGLSYRPWLDHRPSEDIHRGTREGSPLNYRQRDPFPAK